MSPAQSPARHVVPSRASKKQAPRRLQAVASKKKARAEKKQALVPYVCGGIVVASLVAVVVGQSLLAQGQMQLTNLQAQITATEQSLPSAQLSVAQLETPAKVVGSAEKNTGLTPEGDVIELPSVPLTKPLAPPVLSTPTTSVTTKGVNTSITSDTQNVASSSQVTGP